MSLSRAGILLLVVTTLAALSVVPEWPFSRLDDPSYWGLLGYLVVFVLLLVRRDAGWSERAPNRRVVRLFLVGAALVYVADWLRFGGTGVELGVELVGLGVWSALALRAGRSDLALWGGCVAHALWDGLHFGRVDFVPDWYVAACLAVDVGLGAFVLLRLAGAGAASQASSS